MNRKKLFDIDKHNLLFHNKALFALLIPIVIEHHWWIRLITL